MALSRTITIKSSEIETQFDVDSAGETTTLRVNMEVYGEGVFEEYIPMADILNLLIEVIEGGTHGT